MLNIQVSNFFVLLPQLALCGVCELSCLSQQRESVARGRLEGRGNYPGMESITSATCWSTRGSWSICMHPFAMETAAILVHSLNRFSLCTKMAAVMIAKLLVCCDIICNTL